MSFIQLLQLERSLSSPYNLRVKGHNYRTLCKESAKEMKYSSTILLYNPRLQYYTFMGKKDFITVERVQSSTRQ